MGGNRIFTDHGRPAGEGARRIVVILGPTASGKTELAVRLAERFDGEIVNADSMQVYRGMDIGTAKPDHALRERIPHHLIDVVDPSENFTVSDYRAEADRAISAIVGRGKQPFVVGGTGFYIRALLQGLGAFPGGSDSIRSELQEIVREQGGEELLCRLGEVDPHLAARLHPNDHVRIIRALEVYLLSGKPLSHFQSQHGFGEIFYECLKIGIDVDRGELYRRINERVDRMLQEGLVEEVRGLLDRGLTRDLKSMRSIGYKEMCAFLAGEIDLSRAVELIKRDSRRYAKRQVTWFKADPAINWLEYPDNFATICNHVIDFISKGEDHGKGTL